MSNLSDRQPTAERLLQAAIELLDAGGEAAVRVDKVSAAAGVTAPSIYHFFGDREGLVVAAQAERYRRTLVFGIKENAALVRSCSSGDEFAELIRNWIKGLGAPDGVRRRRIRTEVLGSSASRPALRAQLEAVDVEATEGIAALIAIAQDRGWASTRFNAEIAALWWYGMMNGRYLVEGNRTDDERAQWDEVAGEAVLRIFGPSPSP